MVPGTLSARDIDGSNVAHYAAAEGHINVLRYLHQVVPATLSVSDAAGSNAAHLVANNGHLDVLRCLYQLVPATLSVVNIHGHTGASHAREQGHISAAEYLDACDFWTPLMAASADRLPGRVKELLRSGADCHAEIVYQDVTITALLIGQNLPQEFSWSLEVCPVTFRLLKQAMCWTPPSVPPWIQARSETYFGDEAGVGAAAADGTVAHDFGRVTSQLVY